MSSAEGQNENCGVIAALHSQISELNIASTLKDLDHARTNGELVDARVELSGLQHRLKNAVNALNKIRTIYSDGLEVDNIARRAIEEIAAEGEFGYQGGEFDPESI